MTKTSPEVITGLKSVLANTYALYLKTQNFHWNVTGPHFKFLHEMFQSQYENLAEAIDNVAERIRSKGELAPGGFKKFMELSKISDASYGLKSNQMLEQLLKDHKTLLEELYQSLKDSQNSGDEGTADMLIERILYHEKQTWMIDSSL